MLIDRQLLRALMLTLALPTLAAADDSQKAEPRKAESKKTDTFTQKPQIQPSVVQKEDGTIHKVELDEPEKELKVSGGPDAQWIWNQGDAAQKCFIHKEFEADSESAVMIATCDNGMTVRINGKKVAQSNEWGRPVVVNVQDPLKSGTNEITVAATNEGSIGGFALKLQMTKEDGSKEYLVTDETWTIAKDKGFSEKYETKTLGKMGVDPWNDVFANPGGATSNELLQSSVPRGVFLVKEGFQVEQLYEVPKDKQGSWVCLTTDPQGRLLASDQGGKGIYRITPSPIGSNKPTKVEKLDLPITSAQGMLWAFDSLYLSVNGGPGSGFYRATDSDDDGELDKVEKLRNFRGGGEHGPHALRLSPDGESIYVIAGNHTNPPSDFDSSRVPSNWSEDLLLPRQWDARGHARGKLAPGGWIAKTDPEGKTWEIVSIGYRNSYDFDFSPVGELFAYDADMEWDMGTSWYRPTRVVHAVSGSEFGWRSGTGKWPPYYLDSLPPVLNIGPGSPVGVSFGTGAGFPAKYQRALFCCDWTFGTIYAVHLTPNGSTYLGQKEEFVARTPLPLTDVVIGDDGAMYFTIGGRNSQSALFRVTYTGEESTVPALIEQTPETVEREVRNQLEELHEPGNSSSENVDFIWGHLGHHDRFIRYAARVALEFQEPELWQQRLLDETFPETYMTGTVAFARQGNPELKDLVFDRLINIDISELTEFQKLEWLRACGLLFIRMGEPTADQKEAISRRLEPEYPAKSDRLNRELSRMLVYVNSPYVIDRTLKLIEQDLQKQSEAAIPEVLSRNSRYGGKIAQMLTNMPDVEEVHLVFVLRNMKYGWTLEQRRQYLDWFARASKKQGGASFQGFLENIRKEFLENATEAERAALESEIAASAPKEDELPKPKGPGRKWTTQEVLALIGDDGLSGRDFENGRRTYAAARCISCHRFLGQGGSTGPDLSNVAGRFNHKDLIDSLINPSKTISDQYKATIVATSDGQVYTGRIISETDDRITMLTDPVDATKTVDIPKDEIEGMKPSPASLMPAKLLNQLNQDEVLDLLAYLLSRGNPEDPAFTE